jgi:hypothetical protein
MVVYPIFKNISVLLMEETRDAIGQGGFGLIYLGKIQLDVKYLNIYCTTDTLIFGSLFALECGLLFSAK